MFIDIVAVAKGRRRRSHKPRANSSFVLLLHQHHLHQRGRRRRVCFKRRSGRRVCRKSREHLGERIEGRSIRAATEHSKSSLLAIMVEKKMRFLVEVQANYFMNKIKKDALMWFDCRYYIGCSVLITTVLHLNSFLYYQTTASIIWPYHPR